MNPDLEMSYGLTRLPPLERTYAMGPDQLNFGLSAMPTPSPVEVPMPTPHQSVLHLHEETKDTQRLYDNILEQSRTIGQQSQTIDRLVNKLEEANQTYLTLHDQYQEMKGKYLELLQEAPNRNNLSVTTSRLSPSSISPSDSVSQMSTPEPTLIDHPVNRPPEYPPGVLWEYEDLPVHANVKVSESNKSRVPARKSVRTAQGLAISKSQWDDIQQSATKIVREVLHSLVKEDVTVTCGKKYFKANWPKQWNVVLAKIEARQPLLQLCSFHWKAEAVIVNTLGSSAGKVKIRPATPPVPPLLSQTAAPQPTLQPAAQPAHAVVPSLLVPPPALPQTAESTRPDSPPSSSVVSQARSFMSPLKHSKHKITPNSPAVQVKKRRFTTTNSSAPAIPNVIVSPAGKVDISSIKVPASYKNLKVILTNDPDYNRVPNGLCLLEALHGLPETAEASSSPAVEEFLVGIENADPNSPDIDEDNTNASWGHYHFRCGIQFDNLTWERVANKQTAYRLLAATIKACRISRHLCFKHHISVKGVLADMYLERIIENLWKHFEASSDVSSQPPDAPGQAHSQGPDLGSSTSTTEVCLEAQELPKLKKLRYNQLKALVEKLSIAVSPRNGKKISKEDCIVALASVPPAEINQHMKEVLAIPKGAVI